jgi:hypothetical protein
VGYIAEILTCLADQLVPVPPSISRAQEARGSLTGGPSLPVTGPVAQRSVWDYRRASPGSQTSRSRGSRRLLDKRTSSNGYRRASSERRAHPLGMLDNVLAKERASI